MKRSARRTATKPIEVPLPTTAAIGFEPGTRRFRMGGCNIYVSRSHVGWHMSISHSDRYPTWDEIAGARYDLIPNEVTMALLLPPQEKYMNIHPNCFHLWQVDDPDNSPATFQR